MDEAARINFESMVSAAKKSCVCQTKVSGGYFLILRNILTGSAPALRTLILESFGAAPVLPVAVTCATLLSACMVSLMYFPKNLLNIHTNV